MKIKSSQEALCIACEMERGAIQLYERALSLMSEANRTHEPLYASLSQMLADEQAHYQMFRALYCGLDAQVERQLILSAVASGILFEGGLMGAVRSGLLNTIGDMLAYAQEQETKAVDAYCGFAEQSPDEQAKATLFSISAEESKHILDIRARQAELSERRD